MMKRIYRDITILLLTAVLAACANMLDPPQLTEEAETGTVYIVIDGNSAGARTLAPDLAITRYTASFAGSGTHADVDITEGSAPVDLAPGNWTITVTAFTGTAPSDSGTGRGSATVTVESGQTHTADITIGPITGDGRKGDFAYSVSIPSVDNAGLSLTSVAASIAVDGTPIDLKGAAGGSPGIASGKLIDLDAGYYRMSIRLEQDGIYVGRTEIVHIYGGFETEAEYVFTNDDFFTVETVTVSPATASVDRGDTHTFTAMVEGIGSPPQTVTWTVAGGVTETLITAGGELTVDANETATTLTVMAVSTADTSKYDTAAVTVTVPATVVAAAFRSDHSAVLAQTVGSIAIGDEAAVDAALAAYNDFSPAVQALLTDEKTLLDGLKTKIDELKVAEAFRSDHSAVLAQTVGNIAIGDEAAMDAALAAYNSLSPEVQALLTDEKTLLDDLKTKIEELKVAEAFRSDHSAVLAQTVGNIAIGDEAAVDAALAAYNDFSPAVQALLTDEKTLLDNLETKIEELKVAEAFRSDHSAILAQTVGSIAISDETAVDDALDAYDSLSSTVQALLTDEKSLLDDLKTKIEELKAAEAFRSAHSAILAKTVGNIAIVDETAVDAALSAYNSLSPAVQDLLTDEKTLLDDLKTKIEELADQAAAAFRSDHSAILAKTVGNIAIADEAAVDDALDAYDSLSSTVQALLTDEKTLLDDLKTKIGMLGPGSITLVYPTDAASGALSDSPITIAKTTGTYPTSHIITVNGVFDSYRWRVDGLVKGNGTTLTLNAGDYVLGTHQISLEVTLNGAVYSKSGSFTVQ
jgi:hypothetical protein